MEYRERIVGGRGWLILGVLGVGSFTGLMLHDPDAWIQAAIIVGMIGGIAALTMWSTNVYGAIRITDTQVRVGRSKVPLAQIVPGSVEQIAPEGARGRLLGGAYAAPVGTTLVRFRREPYENLLVASRRPESFADALEEALTRGR